MAANNSTAKSTSNAGNTGNKRTKQATYIANSFATILSHYDQREDTSVTLVGGRSLVINVNFTDQALQDGSIPSINVAPWGSLQFQLYNPQNKARRMIMDKAGDGYATDSKGNLLCPYDGTPLKVWNVGLYQRDDGKRVLVHISRDYEQAKENANNSESEDDKQGDSVDDISF